MQKHIYVGRRKSAIARVQFVKGSGDFIINNKSNFDYLQQNEFAKQTVIAPLLLVHLEMKYNIVCSVHGGGLSAQAGALQLAIARAVSQQGTPVFPTGAPGKETSPVPQAADSARSLLKARGFLTRDSRIKERRKYGLKKARKAEQYSKR